MTNREPPLGQHSLEAIEARLQRATPEPRLVDEEDQWPAPPCIFHPTGPAEDDCEILSGGFDEQEKADAHFVANARTDVGLLVAAVRAAQWWVGTQGTPAEFQARERLQEALDALV